MTNVKEKIFYGLMKSRFYPHIFFHSNPFKIYEFGELTRGVRPRRTDRVLDIGCGAGLQTRILARTSGRTIGIDVSRQALDRALSEVPASGDARVEFRMTTIEEAGFTEGEFDKVFSVCVIEHIPDYRRVFRECHRVLKPGGVLSFSVDSLKTIHDELFLANHTREHKVIRYFGRDELKKELESAGFREVSVKPILRGAFARDLFVEHMRERTTFRYSRAIVLSHFLKWADSFSRGDEGIFLIARAWK